MAPASGKVTCAAGRPSSHPSEPEHPSVTSSQPSARIQKLLAHSCVPSARRGGGLGTNQSVTSRLAKQATGGQLAWASGVHIRPVPRDPHWAWDSGVPCCGPLLSCGHLRDAAPGPIPLLTAGAGFQGTGEGQRASPDMPSSQQHPRPESFLTTKEEKNERPAAGEELEFRGNGRGQVPTRRIYCCLQGRDGDSSLSSHGSCTRRNPLTTPHLTAPHPGLLWGTRIPSVPGPCPLPSSKLTGGLPTARTPTRRASRSSYMSRLKFDKPSRSSPFCLPLPTSPLRPFGNPGPTWGGQRGASSHRQACAHQAVLAGRCARPSCVGGFFPIWSRNT